MMRKTLAYVIFTLVFLVGIFVLPFRGGDCVAAVLATASVLVFTRRPAVALLVAISVVLTIVIPYAIAYFVIAGPVGISPFDARYLTATNLFWAVLPTTLVVLQAVASRIYLERRATRDAQP